MTAHRSSLSRVARLLCLAALGLPLVTGCMTVSPRAMAPSPGLSARPAPPPQPAPPPRGEPAVGGPPMVSWSSPSAPPAPPTPTPVPTPAAPPVAEEAHTPPRHPPRRPGPTHGQPQTRRPAAPAKSAAAPGRPLPSNACDGLAEYGLFPSGGVSHRWCLAQQQGR